MFSKWYQPVKSLLFVAIHSHHSRFLYVQPFFFFFLMKVVTKRRNAARTPEVSACCHNGIKEQKLGKNRLEGCFLLLKISGLHKSLSSSGGHDLLRILLPHLELSSKKKRSSQSFSSLNCRQDHYITDAAVFWSTTSPVHLQHKYNNSRKK